LSAIVLSGILSEATLRPLTLQARAPAEARAGATAFLPIVARNTAKRLPAFGVETTALIDAQRQPRPEGEATAASRGDAIPVRCGFELKLEPGSERVAMGRFVPAQRGLHRVRELRAATAYPFGFFEKSRKLREKRVTEFWVLPRVVDVTGLALTLAARLGETPLSCPGKGDDFFALRPYRVGDDLRRVYWRRVARTGRLVVVENEAVLGTAVMLELVLGSAAQPETVIEHAIATLGSLAELLLERGLLVGVSGPGLLILPDRGHGQRRSILVALAQWNPLDSLKIQAPSLNVCRIVLTLEKGLTVAGADAVLVLSAGASPEGEEALP
jgi:uncharacterized protein (DUF58 family)